MGACESTPGHAVSVAPRCVPAPAHKLPAFSPAGGWGAAGASGVGLLWVHEGAAIHFTGMDISSLHRDGWPHEQPLHASLLRLPAPTICTQCSLQGVKNNLAMKHVPWVLPRNDTLAGTPAPAQQAAGSRKRQTGRPPDLQHFLRGRLYGRMWIQQAHCQLPHTIYSLLTTNRPTTRPSAGPKGRRGDQVGGFTLMNVADLRRVAPLWLKYTEDVRFDPDVSRVRCRA